MTRKPLYKQREKSKVSDRRLVNQIEPGRKFGEWTVLKKAKKLDYLMCKCTCGVERPVHVYSLTTGKSVSCGCLRKLKKETKEEVVNEA